VQEKPDALRKIERETERVAQAHEVSRYDGQLTDREFELAKREAQIKFQKYRRERNL
jgi:hypothetical protein